MLIAVLVPLSGALRVVPVPAGRLVALGDLHGDFQAARNVLRLAALIDNDDNWCGGDTVLVQLGDLLDRGSEEQALWDLFERLRQQAPLEGGRVVQLLGNHEVLNAIGRAGNYIHPRGHTQFGANRCAAFMPGGELAKALADCPVAAIIGDSLFVHASLPTDATEASLTTLNAETRQWLLGKRPAGPPEALLGGAGSPVWDRTFSSPSDMEPLGTECNSLRITLRRLGVSRLVVGHTPQATVNSACEGSVWRCDTGLSRWVMDGACEALEISERSGVRVLRAPPNGPGASGKKESSSDDLLTSEDALNAPTCQLSVDDFS